jgi:hypothetical protein
MKIKNYVRGDSRAIIVNYPTSIVGGKIFFTLSASKAPADDSAALISKTVVPSLTTIVVNGTTYTIDPALGQGLIMLNNADTQALVPGVYYYDAQVVDTNGSVSSTVADTFQVVADITRRVV